MRILEIKVSDCTAKVTLTDEGKIYVVEEVAGTPANAVFTALNAAISMRRKELADSIDVKTVVEVSWK